VLRIVRRRLALFERPGAGRTCRDDGAAGSLKRCDTSSVVKKRVRIDNQSNIFNSKTERSDVLGYQRRRLRQATVEENMPCIGGN
jgi:hypothetical protein